MNDIRVKICGLREAAHVEAAVRAGAAYLGFNFFEKSPRFVSVAQARELAAIVPPGVARVALTVDADDAFLDRIVREVGLDMLQVHGRESPERVLELRERYGLPVMKAVGIRDERDLPLLEAFGRVADQLLVDAKPAPGARLPGGNGVAFDWQLIANRRWPVPWLLAGGLTADNVAAAVALTGARQVDTSSGVETAPGMKDEQLIADFIRAAQGDRA